MLTFFVVFLYFYIIVFDDSDELSKIKQKIAELEKKINEDNRNGEF